MRRFLSILFWSVIAAAFIGPGTVTTAAVAGANFGDALLWALLFSTMATLVLQEASARLTAVSGLNLGQAIRKQFRRGAGGLLVLLLVLGAIVFGCAAYETGNLLGGVSGAALGSGLPSALLTVVVGVLAGSVLWLGSLRAVSYFLSLIVAVMGGVFLVTAILLKPALPSLLAGSFIPTLPRGSGILILGLIGTTVVPYNLFLGSGMARGQSVGEMRFGLSVSVLLGGVISMAILVVGTAVQQAFTFDALAHALAARVGAWARLFFAVGLFAAGFSSAITAPLAAAVTARSLFQREDAGNWHEKGWRYRSVWLAVLLVGVGFGLADLRPIPAIILAQALNGIVLPFVAVFLLLTVNDRALLGASALNGKISNVLMSLVVTVTIVLGLTNLLKAAASVFGGTLPGERIILGISALFALALAWPTFKWVRLRRGGGRRTKSRL